MARWLAVTLALALSGCLQTAPEPLTPGPEVALDAGLLGRWRCVTRDEQATLELRITETSPRVYRLAFDVPGDDAAVFEGHASTVSGTAVLSVRDRSDDDAPEGWYFAVPTLLRPDVLDLRYVQIEDLDTPPREQVAAAVASGTGMEQGCLCLPVRPEP